MQKAIITDQVHEDLEKACQIIRDYGYKNIELHNVFGKTIEACNDEEIQQIKKIVERYQLQVCNIASTVFFSYYKAKRYLNKTLALRECA